MGYLLVGIPGPNDRGACEIYAVGRQVIETVLISARLVGVPAIRHLRGFWCESRRQWGDL